MINEGKLNFIEYWTKPILDYYWMPFIFIIFSFLLIIILRLKIRSKKIKKLEVEKIWEPFFMSAIIGKINQFPWLKKEHQDHFLQLWNHFQQSLVGESKTNLNTLARLVGADEIAINNIKSKNLKKKLIAVITLGHLKEKKSWRELRKLTESENIPISVMANRSLLQINEKKALPGFIDQLKIREDWAPVLIYPILKELGPDKISDVLANAAITAPSSTKPRIIRYFKLCYSEKVAKVVEETLLSNTHPETISACLKVLTDPSLLDLAKKYLDHPCWFVRVQAVNVFKRLGMPHDDKILIPLLSDSEWWVRYRSAQALVSLPKMNFEKYKEIKSQIINFKAQAMLTEVGVEKFLRRDF